MPPTAFQTSNRESDSAPFAQQRTESRVPLERLLHRQVEPLRRYFSRRVSCRADADDLLQRTLLATLDALPRFRGDVAFSGFVAAIASKLLLHYHRDELRARSRCDADACPDEMQCEQSSVLSRVVHEDEAQELRRVLGQNSDESIRILQLRYWDEHDAEEIGRVLGLSRGAVRTRLHRARGELKRALLGKKSSSRARRKSVTIDAVGERRGNPMPTNHRPPSSIFGLTLAVLTTGVVACNLVDDEPDQPAEENDTEGGSAEMPRSRG